MRQRVVILGQSVDLASAGGGQGAPEWILVLAAGLNRIEDGDPLLMDAQAAELVLKAYGDTGHDMVLDYEHQTLGKGEAPAAGWIKELAWREDGPRPGLWAKVDWTARAAERIAAKEYRYHSPVVIRRADNRVARLINVALTNQPRLKDAPALAAKYTLNLEEGDEDMKNLKKKLGLGADASADQVEELALKAIADLEAAKAKAEGELVVLKKSAPGEGVVACKEVLTALGLAEGADKSKVLGTLESLKAPAEASAELARKVETLTSELGGIKADGLVQEALKSGRTSPAELDAWGRKMAAEQPEMFKQVVFSRPEGAVVPLKAAKPVDGQGSGELTDEQRAINKQLGIDDEVWLKHNPKAEAV